MLNNSKNIAFEFHEYLADRTHWKTIFLSLSGMVAVLAIVVLFGRDVVEEIEVVERWIESHGVLGWVVFVLLIVVMTSLLLPMSLPAMAGGAMFGLTGGVTLTLVGVLLTAAFNYYAARSLLRTSVESWLERHAKLLAIQQAVDRQGLKLQFLIRMTPVNAVVVNYILGATGVRFSTYLLALLGLLPSLILNVYFGYAASHMTKIAGKSGEHSISGGVPTVLGLIVSVAIVVAITRVATKAIKKAESDWSDQEVNSDN